MNAIKEAPASPLIQMFHGELFVRLENISRSHQLNGHQNNIQLGTASPRKMVKFPPGNHILFPNYVWEDQIITAV